MKEDIGTLRLDRLPLDIETGLVGAVRKPFGDDTFAGILIARRQECRIHARDRD